MTVRAWFRQMRAADFAWEVAYAKLDAWVRLEGRGEHWTLFDTQRVVERETEAFYLRPGARRAVLRLRRPRRGPATKLQTAIRAKLEAQAEFVFWWDNHVEKLKGGRPGKTRSRSATGSHAAGKNGIPDRYVIDRWRKKLNDPDSFESVFETACARYTKILEFGSIAHVGHNSGEYEWYTPAEYIEAARAVLGDIDLDPATSEGANKVVKAAEIFTYKDNGLEHPWHGRVWMNPPYAQPPKLPPPRTRVAASERRHGGRDTPDAQSG